MSRSEGVPAPRGRRDLAYLFVPPERVPERLRERSIELAMVPILPGEMDAFLDERRLALDLGPEDERLAALVADGQSVSRIAGELGMSLRGVQRKLARLRRRFQVESTAELAAFLARKGF